MKRLLLILTYIRGFLHWFWLVFYTIWSIFIILFLEFTGQKKNSYQAMRLWAFGLLWFCGIRVKIQNKHNIPEGPFLIMFNHRSYVDILALFQATPKRFHFGAKKTLFSIPLLGFAMRSVGHIPIQREKPKEVHRLYLSLAERIKKGDCFALSPEGGRHAGTGLARFKKGPFIFALNHKLKILPVLIYKAEECMPKGSWFFNIGAWRRTVTVKYLPVVSTEKTDIQKLQNHIYTQMTEHLSIKEKVQ